MKDLDSRLRTLARAEETPLPEGFEARLGETLSALPERRVKKRGRTALTGYFFSSRSLRSAHFLYKKRRTRRSGRGAPPVVQRFLNSL